MAKVKIKSRVTTIKAITHEMRKARNIIAKERDRLRELESDLTDMANDLDEGLVLLDEAIDVFSYKQ